MNYIDAHVHVWTDEFDRYPLASGYTPADMAVPRFLPEDILGHARANGVDRVLLIQMSYYRTDNRYMLDVIRNAPQTFRGIAIVDHHASGLVGQMRELKSLGVRGFRIQPGGASAESWLDGEGYERMFHCGAEERLALCPLIDP